MLKGAHAPFFIKNKLRLGLHDIEVLVVNLFPLKKKKSKS
jgi:hypothetical protein